MYRVMLSRAILAIELYIIYMLIIVASCYRFTSRKLGLTLAAMADEAKQILKRAMRDIIDAHCSHF